MNAVELVLAVGLAAATFVIVGAFIFVFTWGARR